MASKIDCRKKAVTQLRQPRPLQTLSTVFSADVLAAASVGASRWWNQAFSMCFRPTMVRSSQALCPAQFAQRGMSERGRKQFHPARACAHRPTTFSFRMRTGAQEKNDCGSKL
ncbi:unnamed protein product [Effrenium voratum]|nr:unnamed protein product [Effrenium voratum]